MIDIARESILFTNEKQERSICLLKSSIIEFLVYTTQPVKLTYDVFEIIKNNTRALIFLGKKTENLPNEKESRQKASNGK